MVRTPGPEERSPVGHRRRRRIIELSLAIGVPVALVLVWQYFWHVGSLDHRFYPSPGQILTSDGLRDGAVWQDVLISTKRMLAGFLIGSTLGVLVGLAMGVSRLTRAALEPLLTGLYTVPKLALIPVFITIFGIGSDAPRIALIAVTVFFFVWIATMAAVLAVPEGYSEAAVIFRASRRQTFRHVLLPAATPAIFVGLRIAAGVAVLVLIGVELVLSSDGIGNRIEKGRVLLLPEQTYLGILLASLLGVIFAAIVRRIGRRLTPWSTEPK